MAKIFGSFQGANGIKYQNTDILDVSTGDIWFDHANSAVKIYDGTAWNATDEVALGFSKAAGLAVEQDLYARAGQPGFTVLAVGPCTSGKVQGTSLGAGNVVEVYASGTDYESGNVLYREFMGAGEPMLHIP